MSIVLGRPKGDSDARERLIAAALTLFSQRSFHTVSTRELAREAGVDAALIRYYFGSKSGLFEHMVRETLAPVIARFKALSTSHRPDDLGEIMKIYYRAMGPNPGLPRLIVRVLQESPETEPYRIVLSVFDEMLKLTTSWLQQALVGLGELREGLQSDFARLSFVSLMVFPLIAPPVLMQKFGVDFSPDNLSRLAEHNVEVIKQGLLSSDKRGQQ